MYIHACIYIHIYIINVYIYLSVHVCIHENTSIFFHFMYISQRSSTSTNPVLEHTHEHT